MNITRKYRGTKSMNTHNLLTKQAQAELLKTALAGKYTRKGTMGVRRKILESLENAIYGTRPGKLRKRRVARRLNAIKRDRRRLKDLLSSSGKGSASALRQINRLLQENKAVVPAAVGGGTVLGTAAILSRNKGKGKS